MSREVTIKNVFDRVRYRTIIRLLITYADEKRETKIKFSHLKFLLVKNPDYHDQNRTIRNMKSFFSSHLSDNTKERWLQTAKEWVSNNTLSPKEYDRLRKYVQRTENDFLTSRFWGFTEKDKFGSDQALRDALTILKNLGLIVLVKERKGDGYPYYQVTDLCLVTYWRWMIHFSIDKLVPDDWICLKELYNNVMLSAVNQQ